MKKHYIFGVAILLIMCAAIFALYVTNPAELAREYLMQRTNTASARVTVGEQVFRVTTARTENEQARGLMHITQLEDDEGMLFMFERRATKTFWNKDTKIPLMVIWIDGEKVIGLSELPSDSDGVRLVASPSPVTHVLELPLTSALARGIKIGDSVRIDE